MIRVLLVDDHAILRAGLKEIMMRELEPITWGEAQDAQQAMAQILAHDWDLVILDITLPGRSGLDVLRELRQTRPKVPLLILSALPEDQFGKRVLKAGAAGYLTKESAPEELVKAVRKVLSGGRYVSPALAEKLALDLGGKGGEYLHERLSGRELEVLRMIASGMTITQIAEMLHLAVTTIGTHRARILEKMDMTTTAELIRYAVRNNLVD
jgi:DNA-binding NarL/FixJ family response regulator